MIIKVDSINAKLHGVVSRGIKGAEIDENGHLIFTMTDESTVDLGRVNGNGIVSITKTGTSGLVDTYTISFDDDTSTTFYVTNGNGIASVTFKETDSQGNNVYTITFTDGTTAEFTAPRGLKGIQGDTGNGIESTILNSDYTLTINFTDGTSYTTSPIKGVPGDTGVSVTNYQLVSGNHSPGTYDTYRMTLSDGTTFDCKVWNGANGEGSGDMNKAIYSPNYTGELSPKITASGLLKGDGSGGVTAATPGTDYQTPLTTEEAQTLGIDSKPISGSTNLVTSGGVRDAIDALNNNGTVISQNADYAEVGEWADGNTSDEDRIGYFVAVDPSTAGTTMVKATSTMDVRGVTVSAPAFSGNCSTDKFDAETGALLKQYDFVAVMGLVSVIDNGTCTINGRCMPTDDGTAVPSSNNMGYQVIDRIDDTHILIAVEPSADMIQRIKTDIENRYTKTETDTLLANKAPAGYGLGGYAKKLTSDDNLNNILECGYYQIIGTGALPTNAPDYCSKYYISLLHVESAGTYGATQEITCARSYTAGTTGIKLRRVLNGLNSWSEWEYINPPMQLGVEYRTTERYNGKPVYMKAVSCGYMANNKTVDVLTSEYRAISAVLKGSPMAFPMVPKGASISGWQGGFYLDGTAITLYAGTSLADSNNSVVAIIKFIEA